MFVRRVGFELVCFPEIHGTRGARKYTYTDVDWRKIRPILAENLVKISWPLPYLAPQETGDRLNMPKDAPIYYPQVSVLKAELPSAYL